MTTKQKAKLHEVFNSLDADLEIGFATCIADKMRLSCPDVFKAYEEWQVEGLVEQPAPTSTLLEQETTAARVPDWAMSYLVNGDASGLTDADRHMVDVWWSAWVHYSRTINATVTLSCGDDSSLTSHPAFGLPCEATMCQILFFAK